MKQLAQNLAVTEEGPRGRLLCRPLIKPGAWLPMNILSVSIRPSPDWRWQKAHYLVLLSFSHPGLKVLFHFLIILAHKLFISYILTGLLVAATMCKGWGL